jgi:hypothetical protein
MPHSFLKKEEAIYFSYCFIEKDVEESLKPPLLYLILDTLGTGLNNTNMIYYYLQNDLYFFVCR